ALALLLDEAVQLLTPLVDVFAALGQLALLVLDVALLLLQRLLLLVEAVFAFFQPALLLALLGAGLFHLAVELFAFPEQLVLGLQVGFLEDVFGFFFSLLREVGDSGGGAAHAEAVQQAGSAKAGRQPQEQA